VGVRKVSTGLPMELLKGLLLLAVIFIPLERVLAIRPRQKVLRRDWLNDLVYWIVSSQIISLPLAALIAGAVAASDRLVPVSVRSATAAQPYWLQIIEAVVLADLGTYFTHRAFHAIPCLWRFHAIHHSIEELDWLAGARVHPIEQIINKSVPLVPLFVLGFSGWVIGVYVGLYAWQSVFLHSNVRFRFGPLRWLLASPEFHHWHHSKEYQARARNFAGQLPFLDALFGTAYMPRGSRPTSFGIDEPMRQNYLSQLALPFRPKATAASQVQPGRD
jgi:sterol desaturase/sphingolipid hydroxylase (fatty acid hydroxylase superfamily)